jgi:hypothetical protein
VLYRTDMTDFTAVEIADQPPSHLVVAWNDDNSSPLVHSTVAIAAAL